MTVDAPPEVRPAVGWRFPPVRESRLHNGIRLLAYELPGQYVVSSSLVFDLPLNAEPADREGVAGLVARCMARAAGGLSADDFSDALAACGAELEASASPDGFSVQLSVPVSQLARGLDLMAMAVADPSYASKEFEQEKRLRLQEIEHAKAYPGSVTVEAMNAALFGDARAARPVGGSTETVEAVSRDDLAAFAASYLHPGIATLVMAGDFSAVDPRELAERSIGLWRRGPGEVVQPEDSPVSARPRLLLIDWPDAQQATVRLAGRGITRGDPRWPALFVANYVVGGSFGSRLNTVLREQKGLTYGVSSGLDSRRTVGLLGVGASVQSAAAAEAVGEVLGILRDAAGTLTDEEVAVGVRASTDSAALGFERASAVVARVEMLVTHGLPLDHVDRNLERIRSVDAGAANAAYIDVIHPDGLSVVVAGGAAELADPLRALGHADLEILPRP
jgi:zinc protease